MNEQIELQFSGTGQKNNRIKVTQPNQRNEQTIKIGQYQNLFCKKEQTELIGYCYLNNQIIDTKTGTIRPSGKKEN